MASGAVALLSVVGVPVAGNLLPPEQWTQTALKKLPPPGPLDWQLLFGRRSLSGSIIGGLPETQEMLDFCGKHNIVSDVEIIPIQKINEAYERMLKNDVKYRFVIDMGSLK